MRGCASGKRRKLQRRWRDADRDQQHCHRPEEDRRGHPPRPALARVDVRRRRLPHAAAGVEAAKKADFPDKDERRAENKRRMVAAAHARGWPVADDNEADACFVGVAAMAKEAA